jgi:hypothetical protein
MGVGAPRSAIIIKRSLINHRNFFFNQMVGQPGRSGGKREGAGRPPGGNGGRTEGAIDILPRDFGGGITADSARLADRFPPTI